MSLVNTINNYCPKGVPHRHRQKYNLGWGRNRDCCLCAGEQCRKRFNFIEKCDLYKQKVTIKPKMNALVTSILIFSNIKNEKPEFCLPLELQRIIFDFMKIQFQKPIDINLNEPGIKHLMNCKKCAPKFIDWLDKNACPGHVLPRREINFYHFDREYNT